VRNQPWTLLLPLLLGAACTPDPGPFALQAGLHRARIPAPLGIGTVGGRLADATANPSPYADVFPATNRLHGHPDIRVVALSRGEGFELVLVRLDLFAVTEDLRRAVVTALQLRTGRDLDDALILAATRSAAGPGRMGGVKDRFELGADSFLPGYQAALVGAVADAVQAALDDLQPARLGTGAATVEGAFADVRCEDGLDDTPTTVPLLAVERAGAVEALVMVAGLTGGVVPIGELTLSNDAAGAVEQAVEDRFDTPVMALLLQGASADSDPVDPEDRIGDDGGVQSNAFDELDGIGQVFADGVEPSLGALAWEDAPTLAARTRRVKVDREVLDYRTLDFPYEFGADQCLGGTGCTDPQTDPVLDNDCEAFPAEDPAPSVAELTVASAGAFTLATFPGELGAPFAAALAARAAEELGVDPLVLVGQAQG
jgi:hypothetical protein